MEVYKKIKTLIVGKRSFISQELNRNIFNSKLVATDEFKLLYLKQYKYDVLVADLMGKNITDIKCEINWALILGSEAHGISDTFKEFKKVTINKVGNIESLNVSVASGILLDRLINKENFNEE